MLSLQNSAALPESFSFPHALLKSVYIAYNTPKFMKLNDKTSYISFYIGPFFITLAVFVYNTLHELHWLCLPIVPRCLQNRFVIITGRDYLGRHDCMISLKNPVIPGIADKKIGPLSRP